MAKALGSELNVYFRLGLIPIPLKPCSKGPLARWGNGWNPTFEQLEAWASQPSINWAVRCGENLAVIDCDSEEAFHDFVRTHDLPQGCRIVKTSRGYHIWARPKKLIRSRRVDTVEIKCLGSYIVAPPSIHPSGVPYVFKVPPNGALPDLYSSILYG